MGATAGHPGTGAPGEQPDLPQDQPVPPGEQRGQRDPHARLDHELPLLAQERARVPARYRAGVFHHTLDRDEHPAADGAQGLHRAPERAAGCPAEAADPDGRGRPRPRKDDALPAPDR